MDLGLCIKLSKYFVKGGMWLYKGLIAPMVDLNSYVFKPLNDKNKL